MLERLELENILFIDVETVPLAYAYSELEDDEKLFWERKARFLGRGERSAEELYTRAGIYAEFGKVVCISAGFFHSTGKAQQFRIKSFYHAEEADLLSHFGNLLNEHFNSKKHLLCAHNGKEFDFPFLSRRMLINGVPLPNLLDNAGKKPWEVRHLDTMELWRFGDYKSYTSLGLLTHLFKIPTPKGEMDGSDVSRVYWEEKNMDKIVSYCQRDVVAVAQLLLRFKGSPLIEEDQVKVV